MKKSKMIGIAAVSLSAGLLLAACSSSNASGSSDSSGGVPSGVKLPAARVKATSSAPAWKQDTKKAKTLTWFVDQTWWNVNWGQDAVTKQIEKELNIKINFVVGDDTKLNTYFAGGNLPDIITNDSMTNQAAKQQINGLCHCKLWQASMTLILIQSQVHKLWTGTNSLTVILTAILDFLTLQQITAQEISSQKKVLLSRNQSMML